MFVIVSVIDISVCFDGFLCSMSYDSSVIVVGIVFVIMFVVSVEVSCMLLSMSSVKLNVLKNVWRNRLVYLLCVMWCMCDGLYQGVMQMMVIRKCSNVNSIIGMMVMIDLLKLMLLLINVMVVIRKRVWMGMMRNQWKLVWGVVLQLVMLCCDVCCNVK